jgi:hypothetical protein
MIKFALYSLAIAHQPHPNYPCRSIAHATCSATKSDSTTCVSNARYTTAERGIFPNATEILRCQRAYPKRRMVEPRQIFCSKSSAFHAHNAIKTCQSNEQYYLRHGQPIRIAGTPVAADAFVGVGEIMDDKRVAPKRLM